MIDLSVHDNAPVDRFHLSPNCSVIFVGQYADVQIDNCQFEVAVGHVERGRVEGHIDALGALVGCGTPSGMSNADGGCDIGSSGSGLKHGFSFL